jgi:hypothetical protein
MRSSASARRVVVVAIALALGVFACSSNSKGTTQSSTSSSSSSTSGASTSNATGSSSSSSNSGIVVDLRVSGGNVQGGVQRHSIPVGSAVTVRVTSDVADEIHVHGYDLKQDVEAGSTAEISFTADIPGVFEVELENAGFKLADLEVS